jgi:hypothetical protein
MVPDAAQRLKSKMIRSTSVTRPNDNDIPARISTIPQAGTCSHSAARLPDHTSLMLAARTIERQYNVSPGMARIVAALVAAAVVRP